MTPVSPATSQLRALLVFTRRLVIQIDAGMSLMRTLNTVKQDAPAPYDTAAAALMEGIEAGSSLTEAMTAHPELFPPLYIMMVRAGEVGGVLDVTLTRTADWLESGYRLLAQHGETRELAMLYLPKAGALPEDLRQLTAKQQLALLSVFSTAWGMLLNSGVPILQSIETVAQMLPATQRQQALDAITRIRNAERLAPSFTFLPPLMTALIALGEETGQLDTVLMRIGENYRRELELGE